MKIAVEGCAHGELDNIYGTIAHIEKEKNCQIDLLICCGDFQATRNLDDLKCMAVPQKYQDICTFYKYYSGEKVAPVLTVFIGGNHEASNYLQELAYGGWVAPKIYYLGYCGVINIAGLRIGGLSGIFKGRDYCKGRYERPPYNGDSMRSCYHIRNLDVFRLKQMSRRLDIMLSHDWPTNVTDYGNVKTLIKIKPYFEQEIAEGTLGSKPGAELLTSMKPKYWFAGHLHCKFSALVQHQDEERRTTKFLALDKCLPRRRFLQVLDIKHDTGQDVEISYDLEWLTILKFTNHLLSVKKVNMYLPGPGNNERYNFTPTQEEMDLVLQRFNGDLKVPNNFSVTVPPYDPNNSFSSSTLQAQTNAQTTVFCEKLGIDDPMALLIIEPNQSHSDSFQSNISSLDTSSFITSDVDQTFVSPSNVPHRTSFQPPTPSRTPLKLPEPTSFTSTPMKEAELKRSNDEIEVSPVQKDNGNDFSDVNILQQSNTDTQTLESPGPKKFRRRNLALYQSSNDEDT